MATYPTLIFTPGFDAQEQYPDHTFEVQLGDSYTVNSVSTNQPTRAEWSVKRTGLTKEEVDDLVSQLAAWESVTPFYWQPHPAVQRKLYFCEKWTVTPIGFTHYEFAAVFIEDIRGECTSLGALIDPVDINAKLDNASNFLTSFTGNSGNYLIRSTNNLVVRSLHSHSEQIPSTMGTLYDQLTLALACITAYEYTDSAIWLTRAIAYGQAIVDSYYNSSTGVYLPHWLYDIKSNNRLEEIYPTPSSLASGQVNAPFAYIPMLWELYTKLAEHNSTNPQWNTLANSTKSDYITISSFNKQTVIYRRNSGSPTEFPGTAFSGATPIRVSGGLLNQYISLSSTANLLVQNLNINTGVDSGTSFFIQVSSSLDNAIIEFFVSTNTDDSSESQLFKQFYRLGLANQVNTITTNSYELFRYDNLAWYWELGLSSGTIFFESNTFTYNGNSIENVVVRLEDSAVLNINPANSDRSPFRFFIKTVGSVVLRLQDGSGRFWDVTIPEQDWGLYSPTWSSFTWSSANGISQGSNQPNTTSNILSVRFIIDSGNLVYLWWVGQNPPQPISSPSIIYRSGIRYKSPDNKTLFVGDVLVNDSPTDVFFNTPGTVPFSRTINSGTPNEIIGLPHSGYQSPYIWLLWNETSRLNNTLSFLEAARNNYATTVGESGPFAPLYNWPDIRNQLDGTTNQFRFSSNDFLADSGQYQAQILLALAKAWFVNKSNSRLRSLVMGWFQWFDQNFSTRNEILPPIRFPSDSIAIAGNNPGVGALIGEAAMWANLSGGDPAITFRTIKRTLDYLGSEFILPGNPMTGSWSLNQPAFSTLRQYYSWWHGAAISFYSTLIKNKPQITYPPCSEPLSITVTEPPPDICCGGPVLACGLGLVFNQFAIPKASPISSCRMDVLLDQGSAGITFAVPKSTTEWIITISSETYTPD